MGGVKAVSYTHLDVYKRQADKHGWEEKESIKNIIKKYQEELGDNGQILVRASGTEPLDVYKRQGITCIKASGYDEACTIMEQGAVPVMIDENCGVLEKVRPWALVDAILAKKNLGTTRDMADKTIGLGPGFTAGQDVDLVIEDVYKRQI